MTENERLLKDYILGAVRDNAANFVYYDRKEDEDLSASQLKSAVALGIITIDEIAEVFKEVLTKSLK